MTSRCVLIAARCWAITATVGFVPSAHAGLASETIEVVDKAVTTLAEQAGKTGSKEFAEQATKEVAEVVSRCGDEAATAVEKYGTPALRVMKDAEPGAKYLPRTIDRFGEDAIRLAESRAGREILKTENEAIIRAAAKHGDVVFPMLRESGEVAAKALNQVAEKDGLFLAQLRANRTFGDRFDEYLGVVGKYGQRAMDFIRNHWKDLAIAAVGARFLADPGPYIDGAKDLTLGFFEKFMGAVAGHVNWNLWVGVLILLVGGRWYLHRRKVAAAAAATANGGHP